MTVTIRHLEGSPGEFLAFSKSLGGKVTYAAYFHDDIFGAVALVNFVQMLQRQFAAPSVEVKLREDGVQPKNPALLEALRQ